MSIKIPFWATTLTIIGVFVLCSLGTWQIKRLAWKEQLIEKIESRHEADFVEFSPADFSSENEFFKGKIKGTFLYDKTIKLQSRTFDGTPGVHVITPFKLSSGETLLINRGWAPLDYNTEQSEPAKKSGTVTGMIRATRRPNIFVPPNNPDKDRWYSINIEQISIAKTLKNILPVMLYEIDLSKSADDLTYPDANALEIHINNNHKQYAFFWFSLALTLIVVYALRFLRKKKAVKD